MNAVKPVIRNAATLILIAKNSKLKSYFDYRILLLERGAKSKFMVCTIEDADEDHDSWSGKCKT